MKRIQPVLALGIVMVGVSIVLGLALVDRHDAMANSAGCSHVGQLYHVDIHDNHASPENTDAKLCDRLQFTNLDNVTRAIAFGPHEQHVSYDGVAEKTLGQGQSFIITLSDAGLYHFHDHFHDEVSGFFNISK